MNKSALENFEFLDDILEEISPVEMKKIEQRMLNAEKIRKAMDVKGWNNTKLLVEMKMKSPSIITKWLSGTHNFTQDTLVEIGNILNIDFFFKEQHNITISFHYPSLENRTCGFDSFSSLNHILNSNNISASGTKKNNHTVYKA